MNDASKGVVGQNNTDTPEKNQKTPCDKQKFVARDDLSQHIMDEAELDSVAGGEKKPAVRVME